MIEAAGAEAAELLAELHARAFAKPWSAAEIAALMANPAAFALVHFPQIPSRASGMENAQSPERRPFSDRKTAYTFSENGLMAREAAPLGFVMAWAAAGDGEILTLAVAPEARRLGVGAALAAAAAHAAFARGAGRLHLEVAEANLAARALYAKLGFAQVGRRQAYCAGAEDALVLRGALPLDVV